MLSARQAGSSMRAGTVDGRMKRERESSKEDSAVEEGSMASHLVASRIRRRN